jgi:hypothetical protein
MMTEQEFINQEIARWGEDEVFALIDAGFQTVQLTNSHGETKWTWQMPAFKGLTHNSAYATVESAATRGYIAPVL